MLPCFDSYGHSIDNDSCDPPTADPGNNDGNSSGNDPEPPNPPLPDPEPPTPDPEPEPPLNPQEDADGDNLSNADEDAAGSDPYNPDTDHDGLTDNDEITLTGTDPISTDSNVDGVSDYNEFYGNTSVDTDIVGPGETPYDHDGDGINDPTDPDPLSPDNDPDSDGDYVPDSEDSDPADPTEWNDANNNGTNDDAEIPNNDADSDGISNDTDSHPSDPSISNDWNYNNTNDQNEDWDGDGVSNLQDSHSNSNTLWCDWNGNGVNDDSEAGAADSDSDGVADNSDSHIYNSSLWDDWNGNGANDSSESQDSDGDSHSDSNDSDPQNSSLWEDWNRNGTNDSQETTTPPPSDRDSDGVTDDSDSDPDNSSLWSDWNRNGTNDGDETPPPDSDGDGYPDSSDTDPSNSNLWEDANRNGYNDSNEDQFIDNDQDGRVNAFDTHPNDANLWNDQNGNGQNDDNEVTISDSDGDGYQDSSDSHPNDPNLWNDRNGNSTNDELELPPDRDRDGISDQEDQYPDDFDNDGRTDSEEISSGTNPSMSDTDGDGLTDGEEFNAGTTPFHVDTDGDGLTDFEELRAFYTDPLNATQIAQTPPPVETTPPPVDTTPPPADTTPPPADTTPPPADTTPPPADTTPPPADTTPPPADTTPPPADTTPPPVETTPPPVDNTPPPVETTPPPVETTPPPVETTPPPVETTPPPVETTPPPTIPPATTNNLGSYPQTPNAVATSGQLTALPAATVNLQPSFSTMTIVSATAAAATVLNIQPPPVATAQDTVSNSITASSNTPSIVPRQTTGFYGNKTLSSASWNASANLADSDHDGIPDAVEEIYAPLIVTADGDLNGNGKTNLQDYQAGKAIMGGAVGDFDGDGLSDAMESEWLMNKFSFADAYQDPDGDGLLTIEELNGSHGTKTRKAGLVATFPNQKTSGTAMGDIKGTYNLTTRKRPLQTRGYFGLPLSVYSSVGSGPGSYFAWTYGATTKVFGTFFMRENAYSQWMTDSTLRESILFAMNSNEGKMPAKFFDIALSYLPDLSGTGDTPRSYGYDHVPLGYLNWLQGYGFQSPPLGGRGVVSFSSVWEPAQFRLLVNPMDYALIRPPEYIQYGEPRTPNRIYPPNYVFQPDYAVTPAYWRGTVLYPTPLPNGILSQLPSWLTKPATDDIDEDGLPNAWEAKYDIDFRDNSNAELGEWVGSLVDQFGLIRDYSKKWNPRDPSLSQYQWEALNAVDPDHDGRSNLEEYQSGTNPRVSDLEFILNRDSDGDGFSNQLELTLGTNALSAASKPNLNKDDDGDGLTLQQELKTYFTDPLDRDTDGDGLNDGWEAKYFSPTINNLLDSDLRNDPASDADDDTLSNLTEERINTNPWHGDSDRDGDSDAAEYRAGSNPWDLKSTVANPGGLASGSAGSIGSGSLAPFYGIKSPNVSVGVYLSDPNGYSVGRYKVSLRPLEGTADGRTLTSPLVNYGQNVFFTVPAGSKYTIEITSEYVLTSLGHSVFDGTNYLVPLNIFSFYHGINSNISSHISFYPGVVFRYAVPTDAGVLFVPWLQSQTLSGQPTNRARTKLGVGEDVYIALKPSGMPDLSLYGNARTSSITRLPSQNVLSVLTAGTRACEPSVGVNVGGRTLGINFNVVEPIAEKAVKIKDLDYPKETQGAGMQIKATVLPSDVSFYKVEMREVDRGTYGITGTFTGMPASRLRHDPNPNWISLSTDNTWLDTAEFSGFLESEWAAGNYEWLIDVHWRVRSPFSNFDIDGARLPSARRQTQSILDSTGSSKVIKQFGAEQPLEVIRKLAPKVEVVSRDKFLAGSVIVPADGSSFELEFSSPLRSDNIGRYGDLLGGGKTKIYNRVEDIMSETDIAAGGQSPNQKVWFVRDSLNGNKINFYTCFSSVGLAQIKVYRNGSKIPETTVNHTLTPAQDFAEVISEVDAWVKGSAFSWDVGAPSSFAVSKSAYQTQSTQAAPPPSQTPAGNTSLNGPIHILTRPCLIPFYDIILQVKGLTPLTKGMIRGMIKGFDDDWDLASKIAAGGMNAGSWAAAAVHTQLLKFKNDPIERAKHLKLSLDSMIQRFVFEPMARAGGEFARSFSTWENFKKRTDQIMKSLGGGAGQAYAVGEDGLAHIWSGIQQWYDEFVDRMMDDAEQINWRSTPWTTNPLLAGLSAGATFLPYSFGYCIGYIGEQVIMGKGIAFVGKVFVRGGARLALVLSSRTKFAVGTRLYKIKKTVQGAASAIELDAALEKGFVKAGTENLAREVVPIRATAEAVGEMFEAIGKTADGFGYKDFIEESFREGSNLAKLARVVGKEGLFASRLHSLGHVLGTTLSGSALKGFTKAYERMIVLDAVGTGLVRDHFDDLLRIFDPAASVSNKQKLTDALEAYSRPNATSMDLDFTTFMYVVNHDLSNKAMLAGEHPLVVAFRNRVEALWPETVGGIASSMKRYEGVAAARYEIRYGKTLRRTNSADSPYHVQVDYAEVPHVANFLDVKGPIMDDSGILYREFRDNNGNLLGSPSRTTSGVPLNRLEGLATSAVDKIVNNARPTSLIPTTVVLDVFGLSAVEKQLVLTRLQSEAALKNVNLNSIIIMN